MGRAQSAQKSGSSSKRSRRTLGSAYDPDKVERAVREHLSPRDQQSFGSGKFQQIDTPVGPIITQGNIGHQVVSLNEWGVVTEQQILDSLPIQTIHADNCLSYIVLKVFVITGFRIVWDGWNLKIEQKRTSFNITIAKWNYEKCGTPGGESPPNPEPEIPPEGEIEGNYDTFYSCSKEVFAVDFSGVSSHLRSQGSNYPSLVPALKELFPLEAPSSFYFTVSRYDASLSFYGYPLYLEQHYQPGNSHGYGLIPTWITLAGNDLLSTWSEVYYFTQYGGGNITFYYYSKLSTGSITQLPVQVYVFQFNYPFKKNAAALGSLIKEAKFKKSYPYSSPPEEISKSWSFFGHYVLEDCGPVPPPPPLPNPPLLPPMYDCCTATLRLVRQIHEWLGADPKQKIKVPKTLIEPPDKGMLGAVLDWITPDDREITSLPDLLLWINEQNINSMGQWGQTLEIPGGVAESTSGEPIELKPGKIYIPDIATALLQILMLLLNLQDDEPQLKELAAKNLLESHMARQQGVMANYRLEALLKAVGASVREKRVEIPATFSMPVGETTGTNAIDTDKEFKEFLKESKISLPVVEYSDSRDLKDDLRPLLEAAGVIMAIHTIRYKQGTTDDQLKSLLRNEVRKYSTEGLGNTATGGDIGTDWDVWLDRIEEGFGNEGVTDPLNPYGRSRDRRPLIREIGEDQTNM